MTLVALPFLPLLARAAETGHADVQLVAEETSAEPGRPFWVAVFFHIEPGWHLYWRNPGDAGLEPTVTWQLPPGWTADEIKWPYPVKIAAPPVMSYGHTEELVLLVQITPPDTLKPGSMVAVRARVDWLACSDACVAGSAEVETTLSVAAQDPTANGQWTEQFEAARARLPVAPEEWTIRATVDETHIVFIMRPPDGSNADLGGVQFFPYDDNLIDNDAAQTLSAESGEFRLSVRLARTRSEIPQRVTGVLVSTGGWGGALRAKAIEVDVGVERTSLSRNNPIARTPQE